MPDPFRWGDRIPRTWSVLRVGRLLTVASSGRGSLFLIAREASKAADSSGVQRRVGTLSYDFFPIRNCFPCSGIALIGCQSNADADVSRSADAKRDASRTTYRHASAVIEEENGDYALPTVGSRWTTPKDDPKPCNPPTKSLGGLHDRNDPYRNEFGA